MTKLSQNKLGLLATVAAVSLPLLIVGLRPQYLAVIRIQPNSDDPIKLLTTERIARVNGGVAFFEFRASTEQESGGQIVLEICPAAGRQFHPQPPFEIHAGIVAGVAELGSAEYKLHQDEDYGFHLLDSTGRVVMDGKIQVEVYRILDGSHWLIIATGVVASVIQIVLVLWERRMGRHHRKSFQNS